MRIALVTNERSGGATSPEALGEQLASRGADVRRFSIRHLDELASAEGIERIVVAGGDGSIGPAADLAGRMGVALGVIPTGTANDFARAHDLPLDVEAAAALAGDPAAREKRLELGRLRDRPFVNVVSAGLAPAAARHAEAHKSRLGPLAYPVGALKAGARTQPIACAVWVDGHELFSGHAWQIIVSVSGAFGGGSSVEEADPEDGRLHVAVVPRGPRAELAWRALGMRRGDLASQAKVVHREGRAVDLGLPEDADVNLDGELCRPGRLTVERAAFSLVVAPSA